PSLLSRQIAAVDERAELRDGSPARVRSWAAHERYCVATPSWIQSVTWRMFLPPFVRLATESPRPCARRFRALNLAITPESVPLPGGVAVYRRGQVGGQPHRHL